MPTGGGSRLQRGGGLSWRRGGVSRDPSPPGEGIPAAWGVPGGGGSSSGGGGGRDLGPVGARLTAGGEVGTGSSGGWEEDTGEGGRTRKRGGKNTGGGRRRDGGGEGHGTGGVPPATGGGNKEVAKCRMVPGGCGGDQGLERGRRGEAGGPRSGAGTFCQIVPRLLETFPGLRGPLRLRGEGG